MDKMKAILCGSFLFLAACKCPPPPAAPPPVNLELVKNYVGIQQEALNSATEKLQVIQQNTTEVASDVGSLKEILVPVEMSEDVRTKTEEIFASIVEHTNTIQNESENMKREFALIQGEHEKFLKMGEFVDFQAGRILYLENETERLRNEAIQAIYRYLVWVFVLGFVVIIGGSVVAFFVGRKLGISILAIGIVTLGFGAAATFYLKWIALTGFVLIGVGVLATIGLLIYGVFEDRSKKKKLAQATVENVKLIEAVKQKLPEDVKTKFFGEGNIPGIAQVIQNADTQKIVASLRGKDSSNTSTLA